MGQKALFKMKVANEKYDMATGLGRHIEVKGKYGDPKPAPDTAVRRVVGVDPYHRKPAAKMDEKRAFLGMVNESGRVVGANALLGAYYSPDAPQPKPHIITYGMHKAALRGGMSGH
jgi:hypothetical protein